MSARCIWAVLRQRQSMDGPVWLVVSRHETEMEARRAMAAATRAEPFLVRDFQVQKL